ncbi:hypothetical protein ACSBR1_018226 [Camellia fascicularis]
MTHFDKAVTLGETIKTEINGCACKLPTYPFARNQTSVVLGQNIEAEFKPEAEAEPESLPLRVRPFDPERYHHQTHILPTSGGIKCFTEFAHGASEDLLLREPDSHLSAIAIERRCVTIITGATGLQVDLFSLVLEGCIFVKSLLRRCAPPHSASSLISFSPASHWAPSHSPPSWGMSCGCCWHRLKLKRVQVEFFICLVLTILGYIPGIVYALYAMLCVDRDMTRVDYRPLA